MTSRPYQSAVRAKASADTRNKLIAAAAKILGEEDSARFSLDAVARAAGVTRLTVYNQFGSRTALLEAVFDLSAAQAGLHRIPEAMSDPDPEAALGKLVVIFGDFWSADSEMLQELHAAAATDAELRQSLAARNERRRKALSVLLQRLPAVALLNEAGRRDLVDTLFALTSFHFFAELSAGRRAKADVVRIIQSLARDAIARCAQDPMAPGDHPQGH